MRRLKRNVTSMFPEQIAIAISSSSSMWVSWVTGDAQVGLNVIPLDPSIVASEVWYGKESGKYPMKRRGVSMVYSQLYAFEGFWNYTSGIIHHVRIDGLEPGTKYHYRCGDGGFPAMSEEKVFETLPLPGPNSYPCRIAIIGDLGLTSNSTTTLDRVIKNDPSLLVIVGDLAYANQYLTTGGKGAACYPCTFPDSPIRETYQPRWDAWGRFMEPLILRVPMMVIEGNHEIEPQAAGISFQSYLTRFAVPSKESGSNTNFYYSFDAGGVHFIMLGADVDYNRTGAQYAWLKEDLHNMDRSVTPWLVAAWHPPWYNSYKTHYQEFDCMRQEMEALLYQYRVDIVFSSHNEVVLARILLFLKILNRNEISEKVQDMYDVDAYERMNRVYNYTLDPCGPIYITVGDGGNIETADVHHADDKCPSTTEYSFGHGILEVVNSTYALWTWHRNQDEENSNGIKYTWCGCLICALYPQNESEITSSPQSVETFADQKTLQPMETADGFGFHSSGVLIWYLLFFTFIFLHLFWTTCRRHRARRSVRRAID
ncbi:unnamed protein product [Camellia sinensis]